MRYIVREIRLVFRVSSLLRRIFTGGQGSYCTFLSTTCTSRAESKEGSKKRGEGGAKYSDLQHVAGTTHMLAQGSTNRTLSFPFFPFLVLSS